MQDVVAIIANKLPQSIDCFWGIVALCVSVYIARVVWAIIREALGYERPYLDTTRL